MDLVNKAVVSSEKFRRLHEFLRQFAVVDTSIPKVMVDDLVQIPAIYEDRRDVRHGMFLPVGQNKKPKKTTVFFGFS